MLFPLALSVLAKPLPVKPALLLSIDPSTLQKPVSFSWIVISLPPLELDDELLLDELELLDDELDELELDDDELELLLEDELLLDELDDELELLPPEQAGNWKLPLCVPWKPKVVD
jgi:hypothetical protein